MDSRRSAYATILLGLLVFVAGAALPVGAVDRNDERIASQCVCGDWQSPPGGLTSEIMALQSDVKVTVSENTVLGSKPGAGEQTYYLSCGETITLGPPSTPLHVTTATLSSEMVCSPSGCRPVYTYDVLDPDQNYVIVDGRGNSVELEYDPTMLGIYTVVLKATCNGMECPPCTMYVDFVGDDDPCDDPSCKVDQLLLNTGYDHASGATYQPVVADGYWQLVASPNPGLQVPTPAWVIDPNPAWDTLPNSEWISAYQYAGWNQNNKPPAGFYSFERCFCTCEDAALALELQAYVDNKAWFYFDDELIAEQPVDTMTSFQGAPLVNIIDQIAVEPGRHCLRVDVRNWSGVAMGLNIVATVTTSSGGALFLTPDCCTPTGAIIVRKIHDVNGNGKDDNTQANPNQEPGMETITIMVEDSVTGDVFTKLTDANGFAYFNDLPPSTYTVSELYTDFVQTIPGGQGVYTVVVDAGDVIQLVFGNYR